VSFFDEADDEPRRAPRTQPRRSRPAGGGRRPPRDEQAIRTRRTVAVVGVVVFVVVVALLVSRCQVSARNSALKDYANRVYLLIQASDQTAARVFHDLDTANGLGASGAHTALASEVAVAGRQLSRAEGWGVPGEMSRAQQYLVLAMRMRRDGIGVLAAQIESALGTSTSSDAVTAIAAAMARFYASDVVYKGYTAPAIAGQLNAARLGVGTPNGASINPGQFLPDLGWLQRSFIASKLGVTLPGTPQPNVSLTQVAVGTNTMVAGVTNHVQASPPPTFTFTVANDGHSTVYGLSCSISVTGAGIHATGTVAQIAAGGTGTCTVTLPSSPAKNTFNVTAQVGGGSAGAKNSLNFPVQFL
jgi:hypothetical protein